MQKPHMTQLLDGHSKAFREMNTADRALKRAKQTLPKNHVELVKHKINAITAASNMASARWKLRNAQARNIRTELEKEFKTRGKTARYKELDHQLTVYEREREQAAESAEKAAKLLIELKSKK